LEAWGLNVVGPFTSKSSAEHMYILAAINYFSKWVETIALKEVKKENMVNFIQMHVIFQYGVPWYIVTDNDKPFVNKLMTSLCEKFKFSSTTHQCIMHLQMV